MRSNVWFTLTLLARVQLKALVSDRNALQKHVWRARIVLLSANGHGTHAIMREAGVVKTAAWRWQERFIQESVNALPRDKTRPPGVSPLETDVVEQVVALTQQDLPGETTHWTAPAMAEAAGISISSLQRIWRGHNLQPHRVRQFKLSNNSISDAQLHDLARLHVYSLAHAVVVWMMSSNRPYGSHSKA